MNEEKGVEKVTTGTVETGRHEGPFINPARLLELLQYAVDNDPGTERKLMLFYLDEDHEQSLDLVEVYSEARICSMTFRRRA